jgi:hypothetical protein
LAESFISHRIKQELMLKMESNMLSRREPDRTMWFSMWFLGAIATFGIAFFPLIYYSIQRRNKHFGRQRELEQLALTHLRGKGQTPELPAEKLDTRNALLWTASIIFLLPAFYIAYFLSEDLMVHEKRERALLKSLFPDEELHSHDVNVRLCALISVVTLGFGIVYWLYKVFNIYNIHFKEQRKIEEKITTLIEGKSHGEVSGRAQV